VVCERGVHAAAAGAPLRPIDAIRAARTTGAAQGSDRCPGPGAGHTIRTMRGAPCALARWLCVAPLLLLASSRRPARCPTQVISVATLWETRLTRGARSQEARPV
jgi:hypothetical protein